MSQEGMNWEQRDPERMRYIDANGDSHYQETESDLGDEEVVDAVINDKDKVTSWKLQLTADEKKKENPFGQMINMGSSGSRGPRGGGLRQALNYNQDDDKSGLKPAKYGKNIGFSDDIDEIEELNQDVNPKEMFEPLNKGPRGGGLKNALNFQQDQPKIDSSKHSKKIGFFDDLDDLDNVGQDVKPKMVEQPKNSRGLPMLSPTNEP